MQVGRLVAQVVADLAARRPGVDPIAHAVDPQVGVARPLEAERHRVVEQQAHSLPQEGKYNVSHFLSDL